MTQDKIWYKAYPKGVSQTVSPTAFKNLLELADYSVQQYADQVAYQFMGKSITFSELKDHSDSFGAYLQSLGLQKGDKIILQMPNVLQMPIALLGAIKAGLVVVNTNPLYTPREMQHQYKDSEAKAVVILANFAYNLEEILADTDIEHVIITEIGDMLGGFKKTFVNLAVKYLKKMVPSYSIPQALPFSDCLKKGSQMKLKPVEVSNEDTALIQYTGGTTGVSKGAELSHGNLIANVEGIKEWFGPVSNNDIPRLVLGALPLYHIFALTVNTLSGLRLGFNNVLIVNPRDQKALLKDLKKHSFFIFPGLNTLFNALIQNPEFKTVDFKNLRVTIAGGMALQKHVADQWEEITGCRITEGYGLSETSPVLSVNPVDGTQQIGTIGIPFPSTDMRILKEDNSWATVGEIGEICARGPQVMKGYYNRPEATEKTFITDTQGETFFKTGDIGLMHPDGFFKIVDRKKDMINVSGFNVYPNEIEEVLASHPDILEVAAIGVPDDKNNETVKVFVVKKNPTLTEEEVKEYASKNLTNYKRPKLIEFRDELPKTNVGKILRRALKEEEQK